MLGAIRCPTDNVSSAEVMAPHEESDWELQVRKSLCQDSPFAYTVHYPKARDDELRMRAVTCTSKITS